MDDIARLISAGGSPLQLGQIWDRDIRHQISRLTEETMAQAVTTGISEDAAVVETILGLYAHGFYVGRDHALAGLVLPGSARRGLAGLSPESLSSIIIPDDLSSL